MLCRRAGSSPFIINQCPPPPRQGVWAATTTMQLVRRMEWRPPLLYAYPLGHCIPATLKNMQFPRECMRKIAHGARAVWCARCACFPQSCWGQCREIVT